MIPSLQKAITGTLFLIFLGAIGSCAFPKAFEQTDAQPQAASPQATPPMENLVETQQSPPQLAKEDRPSGLVLTQSDMTPKSQRTKQQRFTVSAQDVEVQTILFSLAQEIDQNILIDPAVNQRASVDLKDVTLEEALDGLLTPLKLTYEFDGNFIRVRPLRMETRTFTLNYIISQRQGSSNLESSSGSELTGGGISGGGSSSSGNTRATSSIVSQEEANIWKEIENGLEQIIGVAGQGTPSGPTSTTGTSGASASAPVIASAGFFAINKQSGVIVVRSFPDTLMQVAEFLEAVEGSSHRQVFIQAKILEINLKDEYQLGIDWQTVSPINVLSETTSNFGNADAASTVLQGAAGLTYGLSNSKVNLVIDALSEQGSVTVLSSPKIATLNNQRAVIKVGTEDVFFIPTVSPASQNQAAFTTFQPNTVTIGIILDVVPQISANGMVMMSINTSISEKVRDAISPDGRNRVPVLDVRESNSVVLAQNGQTIIIGGLMKNKSQKENDRLPILGDIPLLGRLFQKQKDFSNKTELVIMLTPEVMVGRKIDDRFMAEKNHLEELGYTVN
ncbi:MAG: secretin N-terminal domain-containing protein [Nitrospinales bacterium]